jgi:hypothetical protein
VARPTPFGDRLTPDRLLAVLDRPVVFADRATLADLLAALAPLDSVTAPLVGCSLAPWRAAAGAAPSDADMSPISAGLDRLVVRGAAVVEHAACGPFLHLDWETGLAGPGADTLHPLEGWPVGQLARLPLQAGPHLLTELDAPRGRARLHDAEAPVALDVPLLAGVLRGLLFSLTTEAVVATPEPSRAA